MLGTMAQGKRVEDSVSCFGMQGIYNPGRMEFTGMDYLWIQLRNHDERKRKKTNKNATPASCW